MKKKFIITIDTEEDNQWDLQISNLTENARYLERFQRLCNKYKFKPVYLTTYNMAKDPFFIKFAKEQLKAGNCEIGMHLHAWCSPPEFKLENKKNNNREYLIEYPIEVMEEKIKVLDKLLEDTFEKKIVSHRSGRWAINEEYISLLAKYGYKCDCSVTPGVNWSNCLGGTGIGGSDFSSYPVNPYYTNGILEVPVSIRNIRYFNLNAIYSFKDVLREAHHLSIGKQTWLRPSNNSLYQMKKLVDIINNESTDYIMFMIHSSEFMPGGSPYYKNNEDIDALFKILDELFMYISNFYEGSTLEEYYSYYLINK